MWSNATTPQAMDERRAVHTNFSDKRPTSDASNIIDSPSTRRRTAHACDRCRQMRTKCTGGIPCEKCLKDDKTCEYGDRRRERNKKDLAQSKAIIQLLEGDLRRMHAFAMRVSLNDAVPANEREEARKLASSFSSYEGTETSRQGSRQSFSSASADSPPENLRVVSKDGPRANAGEERTSSSVGSPGRAGELSVAVDLDHGAGASGFIGKMSEMSWMQRVRDYIQGFPGTSGEMARAEFDRHATVAGNLTYFMDDANLLMIDEDTINPLQWPPYQLAVTLTEAFFHATQSSFRFVLREDFVVTMQSLATGGAAFAWNQRKWLATANIVWAIGSKWLQMVKPEQPISEHHLYFYARARALGLDHRVMFDHPELDSVEGIGLLCFYLFTNGSVSRAYNLLGHAIRHATALGLHLKASADAQIDDIEQERRARVLYSLYSLEILLAETLGRPQVIRVDQITTPTSILGRNSHMPLNEWAFGVQADFNKVRISWLQDILNPHVASGVTQQRHSIIADPGPHAAALHFDYRVQLCQISDQIATQLYGMQPGLTWADTQKRVDTVERSLQQWQQSIPPDLRLEANTNEQHNYRASMELAMYFQSLSMILYRPCLCAIKIQDESAKSKEFNLLAARKCIHAAIGMLDMLPDEPDAHYIMHILPWWAILHYICQVMSVLLLEICMDCQHLPEDGVHSVIFATRKCMAYLWCLSENSISAYRAWRIFRCLSEDLSTRDNEYSMLQFSGDPPHPAGWTRHEESALMTALS